MTDPQQQARTILDQLAFMPFTQCLTIDRQFSQLSALPGIYAIRHCTEGLLYLGKTNDLGMRSHRWLDGEIQRYYQN